MINGSIAAPPARQAPGAGLGSRPWAPAPMEPETHCDALRGDWFRRAGALTDSTWRLAVCRISTHLRERTTWFTREGAKGPTVRSDAAGLRGGIRSSA
ncbi:hypothetical protein GCM10010341_58100 [Streptomyces noursei]|nr:hypothetical protein GCM10010341_58100 [Streptomyces noursei]